MICRIESKDYYVIPLNGNNEVRCSLKGKLKNDFRLKRGKLYKTDIAVIGDYVDFEKADENSGVISGIEERDNYISRKSPKIKGSGYRGERLEQVIAANVDALFIISSVALPYFNNKVIDRFLVTAESSGIKPYLIINKTDLDKENLIDEWTAIYENIGYKVFKSSIVNNSGVAEIKKMLEGKKNLFWGQSGVGKSSLLNKMYPEVNLGVGEISNFTDKGKHTTVTSIMIESGKNTYIIDTPGVREIDPYGIRKEDLGHYFIEFSEYASNCRFNTCTHYHEPGCQVIEAVENNNISPERYDSYLRILETIEQDIVF